MVHNVFIVYLPVKNRFWYIAAVYAAGIVTAAVLHRIDRVLIGMLRKLLPVKEGL